MMRGKQAFGTRQSAFGHVALLEARPDATATVDPINAGLGSCLASRENETVRFTMNGLAEC